MNDKQELEYLRKWYKDDEKQYVFSYVLTLASIVTALATFLAMMRSYNFGEDTPIPAIIGIIIGICAILLIVAFFVNFLGMKKVNIFLP